MDVQSLESRFEGITVNDENHDGSIAHHKSKVYIYDAMLMSGTNQL